MVPDPPEGLRDEAVEAWRAIFTEPQAKGFTKSDRLILERYIVAYDQWVGAMASIAINPLVDGSQGQPVANPLMSWAQSREAVMERCERQLGIGLKNRTDLGVTIGQAKLTAAQINDMTRGGAESGSAKSGAASKRRTKADRERDAIEAEVLGEFEHA